MNSILLKNATVITMDAQRRILKEGAVAIKDGRITEIDWSAGLAKKYACADTVIDCYGDMVLPGMINCHSHAGHAIMGKLAGDMMSLWWNMLIQVYENYSDPEFWYADGMLHAAAALRNGITTTLNVMGSTPMGDEPYAPQSHAKGYTIVGGREFLGVGIPYAEKYPKPYTRWEGGKQVKKLVSIDGMLAGAEEALKTVHGAYNDRVRVFVTPHQQLMDHVPGEKCPQNLLKLTPLELDINARVRALAKKYNTQVYTDTYGGWVTLAFTDKENMLLGSDVLIGMEHVAAANYRELDILAETGTKMYYTAEGYYKRVPISDVICMGIPLSITTNGSAPRTCLDLLEALRRAILVERIFHEDKAYLPAAKALETVTIDAARCLGQEDQIGSLEVGKKADVVVYSPITDYYPYVCPIERLIYAGAGGDFSHVIVDGVLVLKDRHFTQVDEKQILALADAVHMRSVKDNKLEETIDPVIWSKTRMEYI
ncbi:MAG: amidohydrolase family protein [Oscillospiraceae bacterium]|nr:amidohydrolase family protein [Oscillospiraceae bacterium]